MDFNPLDKSQPHRQPSPFRFHHKSRDINIPLLLVIHSIDPPKNKEKRQNKKENLPTKKERNKKTYLCPNIIPTDHAHSHPRHMPLPQPMIHLPPIIPSQRIRPLGHQYLFFSLLIFTLAVVKNRILCWRAGERGRDKWPPAGKDRGEQGGGETHLCKPGRLTPRCVEREKRKFSLFFSAVHNSQISLRERGENLVVVYFKVRGGEVI